MRRGERTEGERGGMGRVGERRRDGGRAVARIMYSARHNNSEICMYAG